MSTWSAEQVRKAGAEILFWQAEMRYWKWICGGLIAAEVAAMSAVVFYLVQRGTSVPYAVCLLPFCCLESLLILGNFRAHDSVSILVEEEGRSRARSVGV
jgi:hypothetical protein